MAPGLSRQLLDPLDLEAFKPSVLQLHIRDFQLNQDTIIGRASHSTQPILCTRTGATGRGCQLPG